MRELLLRRFLLYIFSAHNQTIKVMKNKKDLILIAAVILTALVVACTSCTAGRGMTNCDAAKYKMCGYR